MLSIDLLLHPLDLSPRRIIGIKSFINKYDESLMYKGVPNKGEGVPNKGEFSSLQDALTFYDAVHVSTDINTVIN